MPIASYRPLGVEKLLLVVADIDPVGVCLDKGESNLPTEGETGFAALQLFLAFVSSHALSLAFISTFGLGVSRLPSIAT